MRAAQRENYEYTVPSITGSLFVNNTSDFHGYPFSIQGYNDWRNLAVVKALCFPGDKIIEIGANIGTETIGFSDILGKAGKIYAFEPLPMNLERLKLGISLSKNGNIDLQPYAISHEISKVEFLMPPEKHSGLGHIKGLKVDRKDLRTIEVECRTLDSFEKTIGKVAGLTIDVEGAEPLVLKGGYRFIKKFRPFLILEAQNRHLKRYGYDLTSLFAMIKDLGYEAQEIRRFGLAETDVFSENLSNWLCLPIENRSLFKKVSRFITKCGLTPCFAGWNPLLKSAQERPIEESEYSLSGNRI